MRAGRELVHLFSDVRHEVNNEFTKLLFFLIRLRKGAQLEPERARKHELEIERIARSYLTDEVEARLGELRRHIYEERKELLRRYLRRFGTRVTHAEAGR